MSSHPFVHNRDRERRFFAFDMFETLVVNVKGTVLPIFETLCTYYPDVEPEKVAGTYHDLTRSFKISHHNEELPIDAIIDHLDLAFGYRNDASSMEVPLLIETELYGPAKGVGTMLRYLKDNGYRIGVLSNTRYHSRTLRIMLENCGLIDHIDTVIASADIGHRKPDVLSYRAVCDSLGCEPRECYFCGDSIDKDYYGPLAAGMKGAVLIDPEHKEDVHGRVNSIGDLPSLFK